MKTTITRSYGISPGPGIPWGGPLPGGGYEGKTDKLDKAVQHAAKILKSALHKSVEIRFNSNQESGGAYLVHIAVNCPTIGIGVRMFRRLRRNPKNKYDKVAINRLWFEVVVDKDLVKIPTGHKNDACSLYCHRVKTVGEGLRWIKKNVAI